MGYKSFFYLFFYFFSYFKMSFQQMAARVLVPNLTSTTSPSTSAVSVRAMSNVQRKGKEKVTGKTNALLASTGASFLFFSTSFALYLQSRSTAFETLEQKREQKRQKHAEEAQFALRGDHDQDHDDGHKQKKKW